MVVCHFTFDVEKLSKMEVKVEPKIEFVEITSELHIKLETPANENPSNDSIKCNYCDQYFKKISNLKLHEWSHNNNSKKGKTYKCKDCDKSYTQSSHLRRHEYLSHTKTDCIQCNDPQESTQSPQKPCNNCKPSLNHQDDGNQIIFKCKFCEKTFHKKAYRKKHEDTHSDNRPFKCKFCDKQFRQSAHLKNHELSLHSNERPHKCKYCNICFAQRSHRTQHEMLHIGVKPFECNVCNKTFARATHLRGHITRMH